MKRTLIIGLGTLAVAFVAVFILNNGVPMLGVNVGVKLFGFQIGPGR